MAGRGDAGNGRVRALHRLAVDVSPRPKEARHSNAQGFALLSCSVMRGATWHARV